MCPPTERPDERPYFPSLDGLRFAWFFTVFSAHAFWRLGPRMEQVPYLRLLLLETGEIGISFFFVLSGFLITYLILYEIERVGHVRVWAFYRRRTLRIWPLYYAVLLYAFVVGPLLQDANAAIHAGGVVGLREKLAAAATGLFAYKNIGGAGWYFSYLSNFEVARRLSEGAAPALTDVTWSLAIEEQFYLTWPLWFRLLPKRFHVALFPAVIAGSWLFRFAYVDSYAALKFDALSVMSDMAVGGAAAYAVLNSERFRGFVERLGPRTIAAAYAVGFGLMVFRESVFRGAALVASERLVFSIFFVFIVLEQTYAEGSLLKMERWKTGTRLGVVAYGLYLLHPIAILLVERLAQMAHLDSPGIPATVARAVVALALTIGLALLSYRYFEKPFLKYK